MAENVNVYTRQHVHGGTLGARSSGATHIETNATMGSFPLLSWRAIFAGLLIAFLVSAVLLSLGMALGGGSLQNAVSSQSDGSNLAIGSGIWFIVSGLLALLAGGYYAARVSNFITSRVGAAQGLVIAALFFALFIIEIGMSIGLAGKGVGSAIGLLGPGMSDLSANPRVHGIVSQIIGGSDLKADPDTVIAGIVVRLAQGDADGARNFLAYETGISREEAEVRLNQINVNLQDALKNAEMGTARAITGVGWTLFIILFLGSLSSALGGAWGARQNYRHPIARDIAEIEPVTTEKGTLITPPTVPAPT